MNSKENSLNRKSIRLTGYDYAQNGYYFITICTHHNICLFGQIVNGALLLNDAGQQINNCWQTSSTRFSNIKLHSHVTMPNHFHGIIEIVGVPLVGTQSSQTGQPQGIAPTVGDIIGAFKSISTNQYITGVKQNNWQPFVEKLWQRNYYEHIIRDEASFLKISEYIESNPLKWQDDQYYSP